MIAANGRTPTTVDPAASARDAAAEVLSQYAEECARLRAELTRWRQVAYLIAMRVDRGAVGAELSLRRLAEDIGGRGEVDRAADYLEAAALVQSAMDDEGRDQAELDRLRRVQSAGRST